MKKPVVFFCGLSLSVLLSGCINSYYVANSHNVPLLTEKKDIRATVNYYWTSVDFVSRIPGFEAQGAYALTNHIGIMGSFLTAGQILDTTTFHATYGDLGVGYFFTDKSKKFVAEVYGVYGLGSAKNGFGSLVTSSTDFSKLFIQPVIGYKSRYFNAALSWRIASISHSSLNVSGTLPTTGQVSFDLLKNRPTYTVSEPALTLRAGDDILKFQLQLGWSINSGYPEPRTFGSIGVFLKLPAKKE